MHNGKCNRNIVFMFSLLSNTPKLNVCSMSEGGIASKKWGAHFHSTHETSFLLFFSYFSLHSQIEKEKSNLSKGINFFLSFQFDLMRKKKLFLNFCEISLDLRVIFDNNLIIPVVVELTIA